MVTTRRAGLLIVVTHTPAAVVSVALHTVSVDGESNKSNKLQVSLFWSRDGIFTVSSLLSRGSATLLRLREPKAKYVLITGCHCGKWRLSENTLTSWLNQR